MRVLVAGARSALGSRATRLLKADGHEVIGLTRSPAGPGFVTADVLDADAVRRAVDEARPDAIVQTLNALPKNGPSKYADLEATERLRSDGTRNLLAAAKAAGVTRYVAENFFFVYGRTELGSPALTEDSPLTGTPGQIAEDEQVRATGGVVLRCGLFYGPGVGSTDHLIDLVRRRRAPVVRGATNKLAYLHIDDAAAAVKAALDDGTPGSAYNICDDEPAGPQDMIREIASRIGAAAPRELPLLAIRLAAGEYMRDALSGNLTMSNATARRELNWVPAYPSIRDGVKTLTPK
jgi:nucleoside-diphosphate-sugar epimerase